MRLFAMTPTLKPPAIQTAVPPVNEALAYWEIQKIKALQQKPTRAQQFLLKRARLFEDLLPGWERKLRKRRTGVRILLNNSCNKWAAMQHSRTGNL
jgi:hypothetical protein